MLHRHENEELVVITQPSHGWISGQLADKWGNDELGIERPGPELRIAAEQHDIAWLEWESAPTLNRATGLPYTFSQLPTTEHLEVWSHARKFALNYGRLPALLISMHGTYLYERFHNYDEDAAEDAREARSFLEHEQGYQLELLERIQAERDISQTKIGKMRTHISLWDAMSLRVCMGIEDQAKFELVLSPSEKMTMLFRRQESRDEYAVAPWPFIGDSVHLSCEGRVLDGTFDDVGSMRHALASAPARTLEFSLTPAQP